MEKHMGIDNFEIMEDDFTGKRAGRLTILPYWNKDKYGKKRYLCRCDCGNYKFIPRDSFNANAVKSCGCLRKEVAAENAKNAKRGPRKEPNRYETIGKVTNIYLPNSKMITQIDTEDLEMVKAYRWVSNPDNYVIGYNKERHIYLHRLVMGDPKSDIDHIDRNKLNNKKSNLRLTNQYENSLNRGLHRNNTSGFKGVTHERGMWRASLYKGGIHYSGGFFENKEDAIKKRIEMEKEYYGRVVSL